MVIRFYINGLFDITLTLHELFALVFVLCVLIWLMVYTIVREINVRKFLRQRDEIRKKLGKVK